MSETAVSPSEASRPRAGDSETSLRPIWLAELASQCAVRKVVEGHSKMRLTTLESAHHRLIEVRVRGAGDLGPRAFEEATIRAYGAIAEETAVAPTRHPVRFWNYIPGIHSARERGPDRYMVFNSGRYEAFRRWLGTENLHRLATASGVGHDGPDLIIEALAMDVEGIAVENPRQIPPVQYSRRYGPRPPCFARATLVQGHAPRLLVGGTASVVGEMSVHYRNLAAQIDETLKNLRSLVSSSDLGQPSRFSDLRVYHPRPRDADAIVGTIRHEFPASTRIELMRADLCRRELLVEIEGVMEFGVDRDFPAGRKE